MPRYFYDTEFIEDGKTIGLISIGIVCEDGRELYLQSIEHDPTKASGWVRDNVLNHLVKCPVNHESNVAVDWAYHTVVHGECGSGRNGHVVCPWRSRHHIRSEVLTFMDSIKYGKPELWAYYADYDHVALCQLFGTMMDLPQNWPMYTKDLKQRCDDLGNPKLPIQEGPEHNALADARWNKKVWEFLDEYKVACGYSLYDEGD